MLSSSAASRRGPSRRAAGTLASRRRVLLLLLLLALCGVLLLLRAIYVSALRAMPSGLTAVASHLQTLAGQLLDVEQRPFGKVRCGAVPAPVSAVATPWSAVKSVSAAAAAAAVLARGSTRLAAPAFARRRLQRSAAPLIRAAHRLGLADVLRGGGVCGAFEAAAEVCSAAARLDGSRPLRVLLLDGSAVSWAFTGDEEGGAVLGDIVQWSDLWAALTVLGADVTFLTSRKDLDSVYCDLVGAGATSRRFSDIVPRFDIIFADYIGAYSVDAAAAEAGGGMSLASVAAFRTNRGIRAGPQVALDEALVVVDWFGTSSAHNELPWEVGQHKPYGLYCCRHLPLHRFLTAFPGKNTFLGNHILTPSTFAGPPLKRDLVVLLSGKQCAFLDAVPGLRDAIRIFQAHGWRVVDTIAPESLHGGGCLLPEGTDSLGVVPLEQLHELMGSARVLLGLGRPLLGLQPLEALAAGLVVVLPTYTPPRSCVNDEELAAKPISCDEPWHTQHPALVAMVAEHLAGDPWPSPLITLDVADGAAVARLADDLAARPDSSFVLPAALQPMLDLFSAQAFLLRVARVAVNASCAWRGGCELPMARV